MKHEQTTNLAYLFFLRPACKARGRGQGATFSHRVHVHHQGRPLKIGEVASTKIRPCFLQVVNSCTVGDVYSSTDGQVTNCKQHLRQMERKAKPSLPNHSHPRN